MIISHGLERLNGNKLVIHNDICTCFGYNFYSLMYKGRVIYVGCNLVMDLSIATDNPTTLPPPSPTYM